MDLLLSSVEKDAQRDNMFILKVLSSLWWNTGMRANGSPQNFFVHVEDILRENGWPCSNTTRRRERIIRHFKREYNCIELDDAVFALSESDDPAALLRLEALL